MELNTDPEKKIMNAARKIFYEKGFKSATMREIATEADTNLAMVNYYFRSKENLFYIINDETFTMLLGKVALCIQEDIPIEQKITNIIHEYVDFFMINPHIPSIISGEIIHNPQKIATLMKEKISQSNIHKAFGIQIKKHVDEGIFKPHITTLNIFINILSLTVFPILSQPIIKEAFNLSSEEYNEFIMGRKEEISQMIINSIKV